MKTISVRRYVRVILIIVVVLLCYILGGQSPVWTESTQEKISEMSAEDFQVTIVDEETIIIENLIKDSEAYYCWNITNLVGDSERVSVSADEPMKANDVIQFTYGDLAVIEFQGQVQYDGYYYTSVTFGIEEDGSIYVLDEASATVETAERISRGASNIASLAYLLFLTMLTSIYYLVPKKIQWVILLAGSIFFYLLSGIQYIVFIVLSSAVTYMVGKQMSSNRRIANANMEMEQDSKRKKQKKLALQKQNRQALYNGLVVTLGIMIVIKYTDFILSNINSILHTNIELLSFVMPLGLSFYTFMLIAYSIDIYRGKYEAEENFGKFFLFASFFPHVTQGPISRYNQVVSQLTEYHSFDYDDFCRGAQRILWGFFIKLVLADRIATLVNGIYGSYETYSWIMLMIATLAYSIQIYADFYSSMEIAIGSAQLFGISLPENFMHPYFSTNMPEFWRRWHITLGTWFKDYVFYPISISKGLMKYSVKVRKKFGANVARVVAAIPPIMGVWILTGLWHGASWKFVAWGLFHGTLILLSTAFSSTVAEFLTKIGIKIDRWYYKLLQMVKVFILCSIGRVFFRANSIGEAFVILKNMFTLVTTEKLIDFSLITLELEDYIVLPVAILILLIVSSLQEKFGSVRVLIERRNIVIRWSIWIFLIFAILLFGVYGLGASPVFLYEAF